MNIVILHCHFRPGGVTQVVDNHVRFLKQCTDVEQIFLVSGPQAGGLSDQTLAHVVPLTVPGFGYDTERFDAIQNRVRADEMSKRVKAKLLEHGLKPDETVLHWHNHSLGKNTATPLMIKHLAKQGWSLLLQVHDFAEDNRPENYVRLIEASGTRSKLELDRFLYPGSGKVSYAALTEADTATLSGIGCDASTLFNSVALPCGDLPEQESALEKVRAAMDLPADAQWTLYPVRGIRRKNVGEWLLLTQLLPEGWYSGLTLQPASEAENKSYQRWKEFAASVAPKAVFDAGHHHQVSFADNLSASSKVFSTSVAEGFGMAFLEPWLAHRPVIARRLPGVTADFEKAGVNLVSFYDSIPIPGEREWVTACWRETEAAMNLSITLLPASFQPIRKSAKRDTDAIDFALLTPSRQAEVLTRMANDKGFASAVQNGVPSLVESITNPPDLGIVDANAKAIADHYSIESVGTRLLGLYQSLLTTEPESDRPDPNLAAVDLVNQDRPFYPCRTETLPDA